MIHDIRMFFASLAFGLVVLVLAPPVSAFEGFDDGGGGGLPACATCHGTLANTGPGNLAHDVHAAPTNTCSDCHGSGGFNNPLLDNCVQCHGRDEDAGGDNESVGLARGLRMHHVTMNAAACGNCHSDSLGAAGVGENVLPSFYATAGLDSCDGSEERFGSLTVSLDNDGDGLTDGNDPDCVANVAPIADPAGPYNTTLGSPIVFDGSGSTDSDGSVVSWAWNFGDGSSGTGSSPTHSYSVEGTFTVTLTVTDNDGLTGVDSTSATVSPVGGNTPPVARANGPYQGFVGDTIVFDGSASSDADGAVVRYDWDYGDGTLAADAGPAPTYVYAAAGQYTVTLTVTDDAGDTDSASSSATITEPVAAMDGETQYNSYCASCHGDPWTAPAVDSTLAGAHRVTGARSCSIDASIFGTSVFPDGAPGMEFLQGLVNDGTVGAVEIEEYLNSQAVTGEQRYVTACAGCHGDDGTGGRTREGVLGESASEIREAIREEGTMRFLACLPDTDITSIAAFLGGNTDDDDDDDDGDGGGGSGDLAFLLMLAAIGLGRPIGRRKRRLWFRQRIS